MEEDRYNDRVIPKIHAVATMWHETRYEMTQLLKSIFRMDSDQSARRNAQKYFGIKDPDYYEFEGLFIFTQCLPGAFQKKMPQTGATNIEIVSFDSFLA